MKNIFALTLLAVAVCGCSAMKEYERTYLEGDKYYEGVFEDAGKELSDVYMQ